MGHRAAFRRPDPGVTLRTASDPAPPSVPAHRQRSELEELRRQLEDNSALAGRALREELERSREEQERRHQEELRALQERLDMDKQHWEENYRKKEV